MKYYIQRTIGQFCDTMSQMWEGNDLPTFMRNGNPYCFTDRKVAERVLWRLQVHYPMTTSGFSEMGKHLLPTLPITYTLESFDTSNTQSFATEQHLACFL